MSENSSGHSPEPNNTGTDQSADEVTVIFPDRTSNDMTGFSPGLSSFCVKADYFKVA
jgi:hypothetical protein